MFRTETPMTSGRKSPRDRRIAWFASSSNMRLIMATRWPALPMAAATQASPSGSGGMFIVSVFAEISRTFKGSPRPTVVPSIVQDFHFGMPGRRRASAPREPRYFADPLKKQSRHGVEDRADHNRPAEAEPQG